MGRKLNTHVLVGSTIYEPGTDEADIDGTITADGVWDGDAPAPVVEEDDAAPGYGKRTVEDLTAEVELRNADRGEDDQIAVTGTGKDGNVRKADLVAALEADDQA